MWSTLDRWSSYRLAMSLYWSAYALTGVTVLVGSTVKPLMWGFVALMIFAWLGLFGVLARRMWCLQHAE